VSRDELMKKGKIIYFVPAVLALLTTLILVFAIQDLRVPYRLQLLETDKGKADEYYAYCDLNGDGRSEWLVIYYNSAGNLAITIRDTRTKGVINQFNFPGELTELGPFFDLQDIDANGILDILVCTENHDSLFLSLVDDIYSHPTQVTTFFLDPINRYNDNGDYHFTPGGLSDLNGDGSPEYVCAINGGHSLQPRRVYSIQFRTGQVTRSPLSGAAVIGVHLVDLNLDGRDEILLNTSAPENFKFHIPYRDSVNWLMVLDHTLDFYAPPVALFKSKVRALIPCRFEGRTYLMLLQILVDPPDTNNSQLILFNDHLQPVVSRYFREDNRKTMDLWYGSGIPELEEVRLVRNDYLYHLNMNLQVTDSSRNKVEHGYGVDQVIDLDRDGNMEYVYMGDEQVLVYRDGLEDPVKADLSWVDRAPRFLISSINRSGENPILFIQIGNTRARLLYEQNPWFQYRALVYPGIFILMFGLLLAVFFAMDRLVARRYEKDRLISQLQLQSIKNQLDPHFTYNALNAVGSLIYTEEKDLAYLYLKGLTDLLRMVSGDAGSITWTLSEELDFVQKYLDIEKLRFRDRFQFQITVFEEPLKEQEIPKMSILTFVENSIKHGLRHKKDQWRLTLRIVREGEGVKIGISDNGIGRAAAVKYREDSTGQGIEMMRQYFRQFSEATGKNARFTVTDLFGEDRKAAGTLVEIMIT
jgi:anti-sigma regulatory factor (Ser/Thr protein kinase)